MTNLFQYNRIYLAFVCLGFFRFDYDVRVCYGWKYFSCLTLLLKYPSFVVTHKEYLSGYVG